MSALARPRRKAAAVAEEAAVASAAAELNEDEEWSDEESDDRGDEDDQDEEGDEAPARKVPRKAAASAGRARKKPAAAGAHKRPPGRTPAGMEWDAESGRWVDTDGRARVPSAAASSRGPAVAASSGEPAAASTALVHMTEAGVPPVAGSLEAAGADLPNWQVEYITKANGRTATRFHGALAHSLILTLNPNPDPGPDPDADADPDPDPDAGLTLRLTLTAGPGGAVASTRSQARQGGKLPPVTQKPIGEMTLRELIAERSRGEPMQSSRSKVG